MSWDQSEAAERLLRRPGRGQGSESHSIVCGPLASHVCVYMFECMCSVWVMGLSHRPKHDSPHPHKRTAQAHHTLNIAQSIMYRLFFKIANLCQEEIMWSSATSQMCWINNGTGLYTGSKCMCFDFFSPGNNTKRFCPASSPSRRTTAPTSGDASSCGCAWPPSSCRSTREAGVPDRSVASSGRRSRSGRKRRGGGGGKKKKRREGE